VIVVNGELREVFLRYGVKPERCRLILPYWVPMEAPDLEDAALKQFFSTHDPVLLSVGLLEREYDLPRQLEAFAQLKHEYPRAGLVWVGSGSLELSLRQSLAVHPHGRAVLLRGDLARPQTLAAIARADVLWRTTLYDGDAVSIREALHFGTRVLATDNGMRPANVRLIAPADTAALLDATRLLLAAPRPTRQIQDGENNLRETLSLYEEIQPIRLANT
jgi:glycosyltransferase involved in cell wall biosynthesis